MVIMMMMVIIMIMMMILIRVDGSYLCPECELPLCGERCGAGPWHRPECSVFSRSVSYFSHKLRKS